MKGSDGDGSLPPALGSHENPQALRNRSCALDRPYRMGPRPIEYEPMAALTSHTGFHTTPGASSVPPATVPSCRLWSPRPLREALNGKRYERLEHVATQPIIAPPWHRRGGPERAVAAATLVSVSLPTNLTRAEIAAELYVSVNTVNTHVRSVYSKLGVGDRSSAVQRSRELRLLSTGLSRSSPN